MKLQIMHRSSSAVIPVALVLGLAACSSEEGDGSSIGSGLGGSSGAGANGTAASAGIAGGSASTGAGGMAGGFGAGGAAASGTVQLDAGEVCTGQSAAAEALPIDMYIMLDWSVSMLEPFGDGTFNKWQGVSEAIKQFVVDPRAASIGVGIQFFGVPNTCSIPDYATPVVPVDLASLTGPAIQAAIPATPLGTLTPTYPALAGALQYMKARAAMYPERGQVVVLASDGFPTQCAPVTNGVCPTGGQCTTLPDGMWVMNQGASVTTIAQMAEQAATTDPPVLTFVIGIGTALANLDNIARGGGTEKAFLIESGDAVSQFLDAMLSITLTPIACDYPMPTSIPGNALEMIDIDLVQVIYNSPVNPPLEIPKVRQQGDCALNGGEGWYYDHPTEPTRIHICSGSCDSFRAGSLDIKIGCKPAEGTIQ